MKKPSIQEIAAFEDLTKEQQAKYLKEHPDSKFSPNHTTLKSHAQSYVSHLSDNNTEGMKHHLDAIVQHPNASHIKNMVDKRNNGAHQLNQRIHDAVKDLATNKFLKD